MSAKPVEREVSLNPETLSPQSAAADSVDAHAARRRGAAPRLAARPRRRATLLIFTLGVLTLLALLGVGLLSSIRGQRSRVQLLRASASGPALIDSVVQVVRERLRADLWDDSAPGGPRYLSDPGETPPANARERNEPFDAPGPFDRWLASTTPYRINGPDLNPFTTDDLLVWPHVSYLGSDLLLDNGLYNWPDNSRTIPGVPDPTDFDDAAKNDGKLANVGFMCWPDPAVAPPHYYRRAPEPPLGSDFYNPALDPTLGGTVQLLPIPGSTTNVTIGHARKIWQSAVDSVAAGWTTAHRFPYFDTNQDGIVDLYDADGDGVPDSPISLVLPYPKSRPSDPGQVYAVIRIVDNCSQLNVNTAGVLDSNGNGTFGPGDVNDQYADEYVLGGQPDRQFRGRRVGEVCLDAPLDPTAIGNVALVLDGDRGVNAAMLNGYQHTGTLQTAPAFAADTFYADVVRRLEVGGMQRLGVGDFYGRFGSDDLLTLQNRAGLTSYRAWYAAVVAAPPPSMIERSLPNTAQVAVPSRWVRYRPADVAGWLPALDVETLGRAALLPPVPESNRRRLMTTLSHASERTPRAAAPAIAPGSLQLFDPAAGGSYDPVLVQAMPFAPASAAPPFALPERIDLNAPVNEASAAARAAYLGWLAWAFDNAGDATKGLPVFADPTAVPASVVPRVPLAAQLAANVVDFRDSDDVPTVIEGGAFGTHPVVGLEAQPFINETYTYIRKENVGGTITVATFSAVEILNPYPRVMSNFKLRVGASTITLNNIPAGSSPTGPPGRLVVTNLAWSAMNIPGTSPVPTPPDVQEGEAGLDLVDGGLNPRTVYLLRPDVTVGPATTGTVGATTLDWPCDTFIMDQVFAVAGGAWTIPPDPINPGDVTDQYNLFQREEYDVASGVSDNLTWKFTVGRSRYGSIGASHTLTQPNNVTLADVQPSVWTFRNLGLTPPGLPPPRAFESPAELSRLLAFGNEADAANPSDVAQWKTVPEKLARFQGMAIANPPGLPPGVAIVDANRVAGRLDFADALFGSPPPAPAPFPRTGRIFSYLTCSGGQFDGIDNDGVDFDGDGNYADDPGEYARVAFRQAGLINVNTAPVPVLRTVPWMARRDAADPTLEWDLAAAIVSLRDKRVVPTLFGPGNDADLTALATAGQPFRTLGDLLRASLATPQFDVARFAGPGGMALTDHGTSPGFAAPDYDRDNDQARDAQQDVRARDIYLSRWANILSTRSDVYTVYVALIDENGHYLQRSRFVLDRAPCATERLTFSRQVLPSVQGREDGDYYDDTR
ncbi:MAG: hypothetical protein U1A27_01585 [Phycisphaerae bacterium]